MMKREDFLKAVQENRCMFLGRNEDVTRTMVDLLGSHGYATDLPETEADAVTMYRRSIHPLVIIDWGTGEKWGEDLWRELKRVPGNEYSTFVIGTESNSPQVIEGALMSGVDEYLSLSLPRHLLDFRLRLAEKQARDRVNRLIAEETLSASERRYRLLFENSKDMIYATLPDGTIIEINGAGVELLGYSSRDECIGCNIRDFYESPEDREYYEQLMNEHGYVKDVELVIRPKGGNRIIVLETSTAIRSDDGATTEYRGIIKDITERIRAEQDQMRLNLELTEANRKLKLTQSRLLQQEKLASIGQLAAGVAHEINNPLGFIKSNFGTLERYMSELTSFVNGLRELRSDILVRLENEFRVGEILTDTQDIFRESRDGFDRIISIIKGLRTFARPDTEEIEGEYDLNTAIENALSMTRNEWKYVATIEQNLGAIPRIECAANAINQVWLNLIVNAIQALKQDERKRPKQVTVRTWEEGESVLCEIGDNGPGIPEATIPRIFDPFFTTKPSGQGTGLGLSISYDTVVNRHGGDIVVESTEGEGTRFRVRLPKRYRR